MSSSQPPCTLHHLNHSQSLRVLWALEELSPLPYNLEKYERVQGRAPDSLKKVHHLGKSPVLTVEPVPGSAVERKVTVAESRLVINYIAANYSGGVWTPATAEDRFRDEYWAEFANSTLGSTAILALIFGMIPQQSPWIAKPLMGVISKSAVAQIINELKRPFELMEEALTADKPWFAGAKLGVADFNMSWPMDLCTQRGFFDAKKYPKIAEWVKRVHVRPAYQRAIEKGGAYDLKVFGA
ncbi:hypothetical protein MBLNU459_g5289t1 [Dothideomycetes sp. NU459]